MTATSAAEADQLTLAYRRFIELHGHALADPRSRCSIASLPGPTRIFTFWSPKAAVQFDEFWDRYRTIYDVPPARAPARAREPQDAAART